MIFGNGLKKFDFARQNLDGRAKCLAQKNEKNTACKYTPLIGTLPSTLFSGGASHPALQNIATKGYVLAEYFLHIKHLPKIRSTSDLPLGIQNC